MGQGDSEFEKGVANGSEAALEIVDAAIGAWRVWQADAGN